MKHSVEEVTMALLNCPHAANWEAKHIPLENEVPLEQHEEQLETFNSFVEIVEGTKPTKQQRGVSASSKPFPQGNA